MAALWELLGQDAVVEQTNYRQKLEAV